MMANGKSIDTAVKELVSTMNWYGYSDTAISYVISNSIRPIGRSTVSAIVNLSGRCNVSKKCWSASDLKELVIAMHKAGMKAIPITQAIRQNVMDISEQSVRNFIREHERGKEPDEQQLQLVPDAAPEKKTVGESIKVTKEKYRNYLVLRKIELERMIEECGNANVVYIMAALDSVMRELYKIDGKEV